MKENKRINIFFDYQQAEYGLCTKGNLIHAYYIARYLSRYSKVYGLKPNSPPKVISTETGTLFFTNFFLDLKARSINHLIHFFCSLINYKKIDIIYSRYVYSWKQFGLVLKLLSGKPLILEVNGVPWEEERGFLYNKFFIRIFLYPLKKADKVIFVSNALEYEFGKYLPSISNKSVVVGNGVDEERFIIKDKKSLRLKYDIDVEEFVITFVGAIDDWQGLDLLVSAAGKLKEQHIACRFLIVGRGRSLLKLQELVKKATLENYFMFTGLVYPDKVVDYINIADVCVAPFIQDRKASPIKIFEYMACGKAVIASDIDDIRDLNLEKGIFYFKAGDSDSLASSVESLMKKEAVISESERIRSLVLENYTWAKVVADIYEEVRGTP